MKFDPTLWLYPPKQLLSHILQKNIDMHFQKSFFFESCITRLREMLWKFPREVATVEGKRKIWRVKIKGNIMSSFDEATTNVVYNHKSGGEHYKVEKMRTSDTKKERKNDDKKSWWKDSYEDAREFEHYHGLDWLEMWKTENDIKISIWWTRLWKIYIVNVKDISI